MNKGNRKIKSIILVSLTGLFFFWIANIIFNTKDYGKYSYNIISNKTINDFPLIVNRSNTNNLNYCIGNKNDTLCIFTIDNRHRLLLWQISGFRKCSISELEYFETDNFNHNTWMAHMDNTYGKESLRLQNDLDTIMYANKLGLVFESDYEMIDTKKEENLIYIKAKARGIAISDENNTLKLKAYIESGSKEQEIILFKQNHSFYMAILYPLKEVNNINILEQLNIETL